MQRSMRVFYFLNVANSRDGDRIINTTNIVLYNLVFIDIFMNKLNIILIFYIQNFEPVVTEFCHHKGYYCVNEHMIFALQKKISFSWIRLWYLVIFVKRSGTTLQFG